MNNNNDDWCEYSDLPSPLSYMNNNNEIMKQIVYNSVKCLECNEVIVSRHRHDYVTCECPNKAMADGGNEYGRYGAWIKLRLIISMQMMTLRLLDNMQQEVVGAKMASNH